MCQVGQIDEKRVIFIEQYVVFYLQELAKSGDGPWLIVFYGDGYERRGIKYYFLKGAASHRSSDNALKKMDEFYFQTVGRQYFPDLKGIGWCYTDNGDEVLLKMLQGMHEQNFRALNGYYVYFEKNEGMEEYMIHQQLKNKKEVHTDKPVKAPRAKKFVAKRSIYPVVKRPLQAGAKKPAPMLAVQVLNMVSLFILIICSIIAVTTLNQYDKMKRLEETVIYLEASMEEQNESP